jgi:hypothetical protein
MAAKTKRIRKPRTKKLQKTSDRMISIEVERLFPKRILTPKTRCGDKDNAAELYSPYESLTQTDPIFVQSACEGSDDEFVERVDEGMTNAAIRLFASPEPEPFEIEDVEDRAHRAYVETAFDYSNEDGSGAYRGLDAIGDVPTNPVGVRTGIFRVAKVNDPFLASASAWRRPNGSFAFSANTRTTMVQMIKLTPSEEGAGLNSKPDHDVISQAEEAAYEDEAIYATS